MHVEKGKYYRDGNGRVIGPLMYTGDGEFLHLVAEVYVSDTPPAKRDALRAENEKLRAVLEKLARLGAEPHYGNSVGNIIARAALGEKE
jgi:hypothetical protein